MAATSGLDDHTAIGHSACRLLLDHAAAPADAARRYRNAQLPGDRQSPDQAIAALLDACHDTDVNAAWWIAATLHDDPADGDTGAWRLCRAQAAHTPPHPALQRLAARLLARSDRLSQRTPAGDLATAKACAVLQIAAHAGRGWFSSLGTLPADHDAAALEPLVDTGRPAADQARQFLRTPDTLRGPADARTYLSSQPHTWLRIATTSASFRTEVYAAATLFDPRDPWLVPLPTVLAYDLLRRYGGRQFATPVAIGLHHTLDTITAAEQMAAGLGLLDDLIYAIAAA